MINNTLLIILMFMLAGCSSLASHPTFYAHPEPQNYHRSQSIATGYRNNDWVRDYMAACVPSESARASGIDGCGQRATPRSSWGQGVSIARDTLHFDRALTGTEANARLTLLAERLKYAGEHTRLSVIGHADNRGSAGYNQSLSEQRAHSVAHYFIGQGIGAHRIQTQGAGETQPIASNATAAGRASNRRVEIYLYAQP